MFDSLKQKIRQFFKKEEQVFERKIETAEALETKEKIEPISAEKELKENLVEPKVREEKRELAPKLSLTTRFKKAITGRATITEKDVEDLLADFNLALLESDVAISVADELCEDIRKKLVGREISGNVQKLSEEAIKESLLEVLDQPKMDLVEKIKTSGKKPFIIMFLGPNGHGKSTQIGKLAHYLHKNKITSVISASDTFRAAAIEQIEEIGRKAGTHVIKQKYGADPAAVAFDSIKYAEAHGIDAVLIDTAGRSELNVNLMEQLKKIARVTKPDMKIYVGEALAGNAAMEEAKKFDETVGIDGVILSKTDCDAKGGSLLSIAHVTKKPVLFIGVGQGMDDLVPFEKEWFIERVM